MLRWWHWGALGLTFLGVLLALAAPPPKAFKTIIGTANDTRVVRGVQAPEQNEDGPFRWTDGDAEVRFTGFEEAGNLVIALRATPPQRSTPTPLAVTFFTDHLPPLHVSAAPAWRTYHFLVPRSTQGWSVPTVRMQAEPVRASDGDDRKVGLALSTVEAVRGAGIAPLATLQRAMFLLILLALARHHRHSYHREQRHLRVTAAPEGALAVASWTAPIATAFWLPQLWNAAGFGAAAVVAPPLVRLGVARQHQGTHWWMTRGCGGGYHRHSDALSPTIAHSAWLHAC